LNRSGLPQGSEISVVDRQGRVFGSATFTQVDPAVAAATAGDAGAYMDLKTLNGEARVAAVVPIASDELYVMLSAPRPAAIAIENVNAFSNFALPLLAWLGALVTAWLATDRLVLRWLDYLRRIAALYGSGKWSVQTLRAKRAAPAEINELADAMEDMAVHVRDRTMRLENALASRDAALKEIHHRVKNNLQIINSLLSLQSRKISDPGAVAALDDARSRISALSLIHRSLYENTDISKVQVRSFLGDLVTHLDQALGAADQNIVVESRIDPGLVDTDHAVPLALFTTEAVTSAVKHAFSTMQGGRVTVHYLVGPNETVLCIEDDGGDRNGAGGPGGGLGTTLMSAFAKQLAGVLEEGTSPDGGRMVRIRMKSAQNAVAAAAES
jgi:two-component sensor histidine kinase